MNRCAKGAILFLALIHLFGCTEGWRLDYADPAAQFNAEDVLEKAKPYIGKKITVKGVVTRQDLSDPTNSRIYLQHSICCNLGKFQKMAESYRVGQVVFIDGILKLCEKNNIVLEPAIGRDSKAEFNPVE